MSRVNILGYSYAEFLIVFQSLTGCRGEDLAKALYRQVFRQGIFAPENLFVFRNSKRILEKTRELFEVSCMPVSDICRESGVEKLVFRTRDDFHIETVIIPMEGRKTLCISSQAGCRMGCVFCETGRMKLIRNLTADEIVSQLYHVTFIMGIKIRNIVFMGMGEPLDNFNPVLKAIDNFSDIKGFGFKRTHITVSTCGIADKIEKLGERAGRKCVLAVSVNSADEALRSRLMPVNKKYSLSELKKALLRYPLSGNDVIFIEYVLMKDINDGEKDAVLLIKYIKGLKVRVNLITYNSTSSQNLKPSDKKNRDSFYDSLKRAGIHVTRRNEKGGSIKAACGQLASNHNKA